MESALRHRPPLLLANRSVLNPNTLPFFRLAKRDQELIRKFYVPYWGPIRIAGASAVLRSNAETTVDLPFPGNYRVNSNREIMINGKLVKNGDVVTCSNAVVRLKATPDDEMQSTETPVTLTWASIGKAPRDPEPIGELYGPL